MPEEKRDYYEVMGVPKNASDDEIKKATKSLAYRAVAGVIIFFLPTIVGLVMGFISSFGEIEEDWNVCRSCIVNPTGDECSSYAEDVWNGNL